MIMINISCLLSAQKYDAVTKLESDVTSRDWTIDPYDQNLRSPYRTHVDFSLYQKVCAYNTQVYVVKIT